MNLFENIGVSISGNLILFILGLLLLFAYTLFIYKTTLPPVSNLAKGILIFLRISVLSLLLLLVFDPILKITSTEKIDPKTLVFIDNSKSIFEFTPTEEIVKVNNFLNDLNTNVSHQIDFFTFGSKINKLENVDNIELNDTSTYTEFEPIIKEIKRNNNVASVIIISDGIVNMGKNPLHEFDIMEMPIYSIGIGDTSTYADIIVERINANEFIYAERETEIEIIIRNENVTKDDVTIQLFDNDQLLNSKSIKLSKSGINRVRFPYSSKIEGEHKLTAKVSSNINEQNKSNNSQSRLINVLSSKKKITLLAGGPSPDLSAIIKSIKKNEDFEISKIIEVSRNNYYKNQSDLNLLKESDVIFLVGFPSVNSNPSFIRSVREIIDGENKNIFILLSNTTDFRKVHELSNNIPFIIENISDEFNEVLVSLNNNSSSLIGNTEQIKNDWYNLPPINTSKTKLTPKPNSEILLNDRNGIIPIIFINNDGKKKSVILNAVNIWRWKIKSTNDMQLLDNFILNSIKWLSIGGEEQFFNVFISKKNYKLGEKIIFNANLYNEIFEPINNQEIILTLDGPSEILEFSFSLIADGVYEVEALLDQPGQYNYTAQLVDNPKQLEPVHGNIIVEHIELELVERKSNSRFLESISLTTGGKFSKIDDTDFIIAALDNNYTNKIKYKLVDKELRLSNLQVILLIIVLLFSIEWIIRKVFRMI